MRMPLTFYPLRCLKQTGDSLDAFTKLLNIDRAVSGRHPPDDVPVLQTHELEHTGWYGGSPPIPSDGDVGVLDMDDVF